MKQAWNDLAQVYKTNEKLKIAEIDCIISTELCTSNHIDAYPTLILYKNGQKVSDYLNARDLISFTNFLKNHLEHDEL